jgi:hypothetical protein
MTNSSMQDRPIHDLVAQADRQRRVRAAAAQLQRLAPVAAAIALGASLMGRFLLGWPAWVGLAVLAVAAIAIGAFTYLQLRPRPTSDAMASAVDSDAGLTGELRSAHWFEAQGDRDAWAEFHIKHATTRATGVDWPALYPRDRSPRAWVVTAVLAVAAVALAVRMPAPVRANASAVMTDADVAPQIAALPKDLQDKLAALLAQLDQAAANKDSAAKASTLADLKDLMAKLDPAMQKKLADMLEKKALDKNANNTASAQDAKPDAAETATAGLPEDAKWAQENQAAKMAQTDEKKPADPKNGAASGKAADQKKGDAQSPQAGDATAEATAPLMREAASEQNSKVMMGGGGPMGGDSRPGSGAGNDPTKGAAEALLVAQALKKEMVEANADALGENVDKEDLRRKTEQGKSGLGFTRTAAPRVEPSRATAPPPVPEARRPLLFSYFIRR